MMKSGVYKKTDFFSPIVQVQTTKFRKKLVCAEKCNFYYYFVCFIWHRLHMFHFVSCPYSSSANEIKLMYKYERKVHLNEKRVNLIKNIL